MEGTPPGDALPPPPQRATPARKGARCGAGAGSTRPHRPRRDTRVAEPWLHAPEDERPGEGQRLTPGAPHDGGRHPPRGRPSATPTASSVGPQGRTLWGRCWVHCPHRPRPGHAGRGTWLHAPEDERPREGQCLTPDAPHNGGRQPSPGTPFRHPHSEQRRPARAHAVGPVLGPHAHIDRARDTRAAEPWLRAPEDERPGEGQRLTPGAPHNGGRHPPGNALPPPPQRATPARKGARCGAGAGSTCPHRPHPGHAGRGTLAARSGGRAAREGTAPDTRRPSQRWKAPPPGTPFRQPHSKQRRPARAHAVGPVLGPHARIDRARDTRVAEPWLHATEGERGRGRDSA